MVISSGKRLFTVDEYHRMVDADILHEDDRVELFQGEVVELTPNGPPHASSTATLTQLLTNGVSERGVVRCQMPVILDDKSMPEPDVVIARPQARRYYDKHPRPKDILLVCEVSDSSLFYDLNRKTPHYAACGIPEVWVVDLTTYAIHVFRGPGASGYTQATRVRRGEALTIEALPDVRIAVDDVLAR